MSTKRKLLKYKEETVEYRCLLASTLMACYGSIVIILYIALGGLKSEPIGLTILRSVLMLLIGIGIMSLINWVQSKSKNTAYFKQQAELRKLKELEKTYREYTRLKDKYKNIVK